MKLFDDPDEEKTDLEGARGRPRRDRLGPGRPDAWPGWEDSAVPPRRSGSYLRDLRKLFDKYGYHPSLYGHFGQGCIHCRVGFDLYTADGIEQVPAASWTRPPTWSSATAARCPASTATARPAASSCRRCSAQTLYAGLPRVQGHLGPAVEDEPRQDDRCLRASTENLRLGPDYNPPQPQTHFHYPDDQARSPGPPCAASASASAASEGGQVMCPSYLVTREEKHSTRGRAHLLLEMMNGEVLTDGWKSEAVKDALDLCLACKGCKGDCPVNVDMATYKAEFLSHYYEGRLRPRHAYAMGWIYWWARLASLRAGPGQFLQPDARPERPRQVGRRHRPAAAHAALRHADVQGLVRRRPVRNQGRPPVILWPDTFNNYFHPEVAKAAVEVLEDAGFQVWVPAGVALLRPAAVRLRHAGHGQAPAAANPDTLAAADPGRHPGRRPGAELRRRLPRRDDQPVPQRPGRQAAARTILHAERIPERTAWRTTSRRGWTARPSVHGHCHHKSRAGHEGREGRC